MTRAIIYHNVNQLCLGGSMTFHYMVVSKRQGSKTATDNVLFSTQAELRAVITYQKSVNYIHNRYTY
jgi:hypothetical protein